VIQILVLSNLLRVTFPNEEQKGRKEGRKEREFSFSCFSKNSLFSFLIGCNIFSPISFSSRLYESKKYHQKESHRGIFCLVEKQKGKFCAGKNFAE